MVFLHRYVLLSLLVLPLQALAAEKERPFVDEMSLGAPKTLIEPEYWQEQQAELPPYPASSDLIAFPVDDPKLPYQYFLDGTHLALGEDKIIRYSVEIRSPSGSRNVYFEGMHCEAGEFKTYAYGSRGKFRRVPTPEWKQLKHQHQYRFRQELQKFILCDPGSLTARPPAEIRQVLRRRIGNQNTGFY